MSVSRRPTPGRIRPYLDAAGRPVPGSVAEKLRVDINGVPQGIVLRGRSAEAPVLLFVHGGPGMPEYFLERTHPTRLGELFTVAWWDQRGAGLSAGRHVPSATMHVEQFVEDTIAVADVLRTRFEQERIYLLAHSWGSFIGIQAAHRAPDRFAAYVGMGQVVHQQRSEVLAYQHLLAAYRARGGSRLLRALEAAPVTLDHDLPRAYLKVRDRAMHRIGVGTTREMRSVATGIFLASLRTPESTWGEKLALWRGRVASRRTGLFDDMLHTDLTTVVSALEVPMYVFAGAHDWTANTELARRYVRSVHAPIKGFYTFARSAHSPVFEEPDRAHRILRDDVLRRATALADP